MPRRLTPAPARRRDKRFLVSLPVLLHAGKTVEECTAIDIGHGGVFVSTTVDLPLRQLVRVEMLLPPHALAFTTMGKLVHRVPVGTTTRAPGVGVQFYGLGGIERENWDGFVAYARKHYPETHQQEANLCHATVVDPLHRRSDRHVRTLRATPERLPDLVAFYQRAVDDQRVFLLTSTPAYVGDEVGVQVVHPHSDDVFELEGKVVRCVRDGQTEGLDIALFAMDAERGKRFDEFVYDPIAPFFDDESVGGDDD